MRHVGLTQRVDRITGRGERRDGLDQRWHDVFAKLGAMIVPLPNAAMGAGHLLDALNLEAIVLTGGNDVAQAPQAANVAPERDRLERDLIDVCLDRDIPLLGVCRGMQMMNVALGGYLGRTEGHAGVEHPITVANQAPWPVDWRVNSYHDVCVPVEGLASDLVCLATSENGDVEAFAHVRAACHGIMWHPEREMPPRLEDLKFMKQVLRL